jgi:hypothetical protein
LRKEFEIMKDRRVIGKGLVFRLGILLAVVLFALMLADRAISQGMVDKKETRVRILKILVSCRLHYRHSFHSFG